MFSTCTDCHRIRLYQKQPYSPPAAALTGDLRLRRWGRWGSDPIGLIVAQYTAVRRACQTSHLRVAFAFGEAATGHPLPSGAQTMLSDLRPFRIPLFLTALACFSKHACLRVSHTFHVRQGAVAPSPIVDRRGQSKPDQACRKPTPCRFTRVPILTPERVSPMTLILCIASAPRKAQ